MTRTVHVIDGQSLRDRPALVNQLELRRLGDPMQRPQALVVLGAAPAGPGVVVLPGGRPGARSLRRWLNGRSVDMLMAWGERALTAVGAQTLPCAAVLDGLSDRAIRTAAMHWMRDRRMPVFVSSPMLGDRIDAWTGGRARVHEFAPKHELHHGELDADAVEVLGEGDVGLRVRSVLDPVIRLGLIGQPMRCIATGSFADTSACHSLLRSLQLPGLDSARPRGCAWVGGAAPAATWRGSESVLGLVALWARGSRLILPRGHAAASVLGVDDGTVLNCDVRAGAAVEKMQSQAPVCTRAARIAAWQATDDRCSDELYVAAQRS